MVGPQFRVWGATPRPGRLLPRPAALVSAAAYCRSRHERRSRDRTARALHGRANSRRPGPRGKRCLVVTGGYHSAAIAALLERPAPPPDVAPPAGEPAGERGIYLVPYTLRRLDAANDYAAGMPHAGFYDQVWRQYSASAEQPYLEAGKTVALRVGRALAKAGEPVSLPGRHRGAGAGTAAGGATRYAGGPPGVVRRPGQHLRQRPTGRPPGRGRAGRAFRPAGRPRGGRHGTSSLPGGTAGGPIFAPAVNISSCP